MALSMVLLFTLLCSLQRTREQPRMETAHSLMLFAHHCPPPVSSTRMTTFANSLPLTWLPTMPSSL
ncbi:hypothetical protein PMAYCL1PPCAC_20444, partial [Pristionchus mayeri]